jgi:hypothetical protein
VVGRRAADLEPSRATFAALAALSARLFTCSAARGLQLAGPPTGPGAAAGALGPGVEGDAAAEVHAAGLAALVARYRAQSKAPYCKALGGGASGGGGDGRGDAGGGGEGAVGGASDDEGPRTLLLPAELAGLFTSL